MGHIIGKESTQEALDAASAAITALYETEERHATKLWTTIIKITTDQLCVWVPGLMYRSWVGIFPGKNVVWFALYEGAAYMVVTNLDTRQLMKVTTAKSGTPVIPENESKGAAEYREETWALAETLYALADDALMSSSPEVFKQSLQLAENISQELIMAVGLMSSRRTAGSLIEPKDDPFSGKEWDDLPEM